MPSIDEKSIFGACVNLYVLVIIMEPDAATDLNKKTLKIIDFDQMRDFDHTIAMSVVGAFAWMAPEVLASAYFSKASDAWRWVNN